ncbi:purine nucleoside phosphorylase isoform X2 [Frankliniella occidentalis]|uniref:Purine nucleoside phosphorylase n=1 Tax=Frankliniella occidentalis TaxID=133901 RepID=A0A9C6WY08_FRAOC|nr:purine nucleoside phosphorylase isoform X2 [Frankliniella occidentalis]
MSAPVKIAVSNGTTNGATNGNTNGALNGATNGATQEVNGADLKKMKNANPPKVYIGSPHKEFNPSSNDSMDGNQFPADPLQCRIEPYSPYNSCTYEIVQSVAEFLLSRVTIRPKIGIICGSGMGCLADALTDSTSFPYETIPYFPTPTVPGHMGRLVFGYLGDVPVMCMQGRFHYYEGYPLWKCAMPVRVMKLVGVTHLLASNAAGGLNNNYKVGDIMIIKDHINLLGFAGNNPLMGPNDERFGPRFPAINRAYDYSVRRMAKAVASEMNINNIVHEGVYSVVGGPSFETIAEIRMLAALGVDAVGMSTVHEVITARHCGMTSFAFSLITNKSVTDYESYEEPNHAEVIDMGKHREPVLKEFIARLVKKIEHDRQQSK